MSQVAVQLDFWHTTGGITLKRVVMQAGVIVLLAVADALARDKIVWHDVLMVVRGQVAYLVISTLQTLRDPKIPNTTNETVELKKG